MDKQQDKLEHLKKYAQPFYFEGSSTGVLLTHGLTASPTEMLSLGKSLHEKGFSVHGVCLAGHGTKYQDLPNYSYLDWINSCTEGLNLLAKKCDAIIPIGISMGALLSILLIHDKKNTNFKKIVLLAPAFGLKSKLAKLAPILSHFVKYVYKGDSVLQYYIDHDLYAYYYYPTKAIAQYLKLRRYFHTRSIQIEIPTLIAYGSLDDTIATTEIDQVIRKKFSSKVEIIIEKFPNSGHNFTTDPDAPELFNRIIEFVNT